jgi:uncharacterized protein (UPF0333 family)
MAYPTIDKPYGLQPVNLIGGQVYAGSTRLIKIASAYNTNIFAGDVVKLVSSGTIEKDAGTTTVAANGVAGIFMGCTFTNPVTKQLTFSQYWPAGTVASDAQAYVVDDPDVLFKVAAVSSGTTVAFYGQTVIGNNVALVQNAGSTTSGDSAVAIDGTSAAATVSLPIRIVAGVPDTANASGDFCEFICKFNAPYITLTEGTPNVVAWNGGHMYNNPTGV